MPANPARKTTARNERIAAILAAARSAFEKNGYENTKMSDIADALGIVEGTVFHYFGTKHQLALALIDGFYDEIISRVQQGLQGIEGTRNRLYFIIHFHLTVFIENARFCEMILQESRRMDHALTENIRLKNRDYTQALIDTAQAGIQTGELRPDVNLTLLRNTVYGSIEHALWSTVHDGSTLCASDYASELTGVIYHGICNHGAQRTSEEVSSLINKLNNLL